MAGVRFEDVDLLGALSRIVDLHTQHYKDDFDLDKELISKLAVSDRSEDKQLLWIHLDMGDIQEMIRLLRICSNNLNQYTRRANETGSIYAADIEDIRTRLDSLWDGMDKLIRGFANIS